MAVLAIKLDARAAAGRSRAQDGADTAGGLADQPKCVAADMVHVRIDGGDRRRHGDHGFERVAALGEDQAAGFGGGAMRRRGYAAAISGGVKGHGGRWLITS